MFGSHATVFTASLVCTQCHSVHFKSRRGVLGESERASLLIREGLVCRSQGYGRIGFRGAIFCTLRLVFRLLEKATSKSSRHVLCFVTVYLQARNEPADDRPRRDFWLIVSRSCACHSLTNGISLRGFNPFCYALLKLLLKYTKYQYGDC